MQYHGDSINVKEYLMKTHVHDIIHWKKHITKTKCEI